MSLERFVGKIGSTRRLPIGIGENFLADPIFLLESGILFLATGDFLSNGVAFLFSEPLVQRGYRKIERSVNYVVGELFIGPGLRQMLVRK